MSKEGLRAGGDRACSENARPSGTENQKVRVPIISFQVHRDALTTRTSSCFSFDRAERRQRKKRQFWIIGRTAPSSINGFVTRCRPCAALDLLSSLGFGPNEDMMSKVYDGDVVRTLIIARELVTDSSGFEQAGQHGKFRDFLTCGLFQASRCSSSCPKDCCCYRRSVCANRLPVLKDNLIVKKAQADWVRPMSEHW